MTRLGHDIGECLLKARLGHVGSLKSELKVHKCRSENLPISSSSYENNMSKISHQNTFYVLRYAHVKYTKGLFTNIQKQ